MQSHNLVDLMAQTRSYQAHRKKLAEIMTKSSTKAKVGTFDQKRTKAISSFYNNRDQATKRVTLNKQQQIDKNNDIILKKIIEVNNRNNKIGSAHSATNYQNFTHKSMTNLKKSMQNINEQNQKIAQKLVSTHSSLRQQKLFESFKQHLQRKERIKKYEYDQEVGMVIPKKIKSLQKIKTANELAKISYQSRVSSNQNEQK